MEWVECTAVNRKITRSKERVVTEFALSISVNGKHFNTAMITPMMITEFVYGYLFGQGIIENSSDIKSVTVKGNIAEVTLNKRENRTKQTPEIKSDFQVSKEDILNGLKAILKSEIYFETEAIHSAGLFGAGAKPVCITEDIGRHNALDKIIGYALINGIDLSHTFAASTGRMASDMVSKICHANIPIIATKTAVTHLGFEIGERCGLTIVGFVKDKGMWQIKGTDCTTATTRSMKIYTNPQRIIF